MSKRALVVDNDFFFVEFLVELLEKRGYQVTKAYDGKEGISKLEDGPFDILFSDLIMPKIDGLQLIKIARRKFADSPFPIIAVSGAVVEQRDRLADGDADSFIAKGPLEQMGDQIDKLLDQIEKEGISGNEGNNFLEMSTLYPRQVTGELLETLKFQKAVTESIGFGIVVVDKDARIINATAQALEIMDASLGDILNQHVTSLFPQKERAPLIDSMKGVARDLGLRKISLNVILKSQRIRLTVSLLRFGRDIIGWIVAMEETDQ